jgi:hypothetical protein
MDCDERKSSPGRAGGAVYISLSPSNTHGRAENRHRAAAPGIRQDTTRPPADASFLAARGSEPSRSQPPEKTRNPDGTNAGDSQSPRAPTRPPTGGPTWRQHTACRRSLAPHACQRRNTLLQRGLGHPGGTYRHKARRKQRGHMQMDQDVKEFSINRLEMLKTTDWPQFSPLRRSRRVIPLFGAGRTILPAFSAFCIPLEYYLECSPTRVIKGAA